MFSRKRILCVDDDADTCRLIGAILQDCDVLTAYSLTDALFLAATEPFDLFLLDYRLPDGTGLELMTMLGGLQSDKPVIFLSGVDWLGEEMFLAAGAEGFLRKGETSFTGDLKAHVSKLVDRGH